MNTTYIPDVRPPAGANSVETWEFRPNSTEPDPRMFWGASWTVPGDEIKVSIQGIQRPDGRTKREIFISDCDNRLTIERPRQFAAALRAAVDAAERMNHYDATPSDDMDAAQ
jgi:hypothetical protein